MVFCLDGSSQVAQILQLSVSVCRFLSNVSRLGHATIAVSLLLYAVVNFSGSVCLVFMYWYQGNGYIGAMYQSGETLKGHCN